MISIITPTYNRAALVQRTIQSILNQEFQSWEHIIVDDGSTDDTAAALAPYLKDERITYLKKENTGQADSLNYGVKAAKGEFIVFLDSDDEAYPGWLKAANEKLKDDTGLLSLGAIRKHSDGSSFKEGMKQFRFFGRIFHLKFTCGSLFIRRAVFNAIGGYDASLRANIQTDLGYRLLAYLRSTSLQTVTLNEFHVQINIHEGERIRTNWTRVREGGMQFIQKHYRFIHENDPREISNIYSVIAFSNYKLHRRSEARQFMFKAIRHNPLRIVNYMRMVKYSFL